MPTVHVTELYLGMGESDYLKLYLDLCSFILQIVLRHSLYLTLYSHKNKNAGKLLFCFSGNLNFKEKFFGILFMLMRLEGNIIAQKGNMFVYLFIYLFTGYHMHLCTSPLLIMLPNIVFVKREINNNH